MLISANVESARERDKVHLVDDQPYVGREYVGSSPKPGTPGYGKNVDGDGDASPQAYLVMQPPGSVTRPHFHQTNQFQVFVAGGGTVGKMRADPVTIQYAGANTPYGPIIAEDEGMHYFTLRQRWDSGAKYLPAQNDLLAKDRQRQVVGVADCKAAPASGTETKTLIEPSDDGLLALLVRLGPAGSAMLPEAALGGGQYHVVITGSLLRDGEELGPLSIEFASPEAGEVEIRAGSDGLELVLARFPHLTA
jgi:hypothetical protein